MGAYIYNDGDKNVATIADRNAIAVKFDGMQVTVVDSIADVLTGGGPAKYQWNATLERWLLIWKETVDNLTFFNDSSVIVNGVATCTHYPASQVVWNSLIIDAQNSLVVAELSQLQVNGTDITIGTNAFDGQTLYFTYAYGAIEANVRSITDSPIGW